MKKLLKISLFLLSFGVMTFVACKKEVFTSPTGNTTFTTASSREGLPRVEREMLWFNSYSDAKNFVADLETKEAEPEIFNAAYADLGVNIFAEEVPNLTDHPVCLKTERSLRHISARSIEEARINQQLNAGAEVFSIVEDPFWKTILNKDNAVHIGSRIFKYYDNGGMSIVLNNDWALYERIKTKQFDEIRAEYNLIITSDMRSEWDKYFILGNEGEIIENKNVFIPSIHSSINVNGKRAFFNASLIEGTPSCKWIYSDNTSSFGLLPAREINADEPVSIEISNGNGIITTVLSSPLSCSIENFNITILSNCQVKVELPGFDPSKDPNHNIKWVFSDGTIGTTNPFTKSNATSGTVTCQKIFKNYPGFNGEVACFLTKPFDLGCCAEKKSISRQRIFTNAGGSGSDWRIDASLWVKNGEVGCESKHFKKNGIGVFVLSSLFANVNGACVDIQGNYLREQIVKGVKSCNVQNVPNPSGNCLKQGQWSGSVSLSIPDNNVIFADPGKLSSGHRLRVPGGAAWFGFGLNGVPRLVLN